jgi:predicted NAD/FAD-dependent oxidoreductase
MSDAPKFLAKDLDVINSERVCEVSREIDVWVVRTESGLQLTADYLVVTTPVPQALDLLDTSGLDYAGEDKKALRNIRYSKGLATMALLDGPSGLSKEGHERIMNAPLSWIADNKIKGISPGVSAVTIHADAKFAEEHWDSPDEIRGPLMLKAAEPWLGSPVQEYTCHRWGFTLPQNPWFEKQFSNSGLKLTLAGDAFGGARVEGAALSGIEAARVVLQNVGISLRGS